MLENTSSTDRNRGSLRISFSETVTDISENSLIHRKNEAVKNCSVWFICLTVENVRSTMGTYWTANVRTGFAGEKSGRRRLGGLSYREPVRERLILLSRSVSNLNGVSKVVKPLLIVFLFVMSSAMLLVRRIVR